MDSQNEWIYAASKYRQGKKRRTPSKETYTAGEVFKGDNIYRKPAYARPI